jgi:hypothetical protein
MDLWGSSGQVDRSYCESEPSFLAALNESLSKFFAYDVQSLHAHTRAPPQNYEGPIQHLSNRFTYMSSRIGTVTTRPTIHYRDRFLASNSQLAFAF